MCGFPPRVGPALAELLSARWLALRDCQTAQAKLFGREGSVSVTAAQQRSLRNWLELWSRGPVEPGTPGDIVGRLLTFNQMARSPWREGDVDVLVAENQGVWLWGRTDQGNFVERENESGRPWLPTLEDEEAFWLHQAAFEFLSSRFPAYRSQNDASREQAAELLHATDPLPCGEWRWPGRRQQMRCRGDSLAMVCDDEEYWWLMLGGPDEASLEWTDGLSLTWDESDSRRH